MTYYVMIKNGSGDDHQEDDHQEWVEFLKTSDAQKAIDLYAEYLEHYGRDDVLFAQSIDVAVNVLVHSSSLDLEASYGKKNDKQLE